MTTDRSTSAKSPSTATLERSEADGATGTRRLPTRKPATKNRTTSARNASARSGSARSGSARSGSARSGSARTAKTASTTSTRTAPPPAISKTTHKGDKPRSKSEAASEQAKFDHWFETPMFEPEPDEKWEELATSKRAPMRLAASALLRVDAATSFLRRASRRSQDPDVIDLRDALDAQFHSSPDLEVEPEPTPEPEPIPVARAKRVHRPKLPAHRPADAAHAAAVEEFFLAGAGGPAVGFEAPADGIRARLGQLLDTWAEREAAAEVKLERLIIPRRWRS